MSFKRFLGILLFLLCSQHTIAQLSKTHYIPPLTNDDGFSDQYIYISTPKNQSIAYKITAIGQPDLPAYSGVVSSTNPVEQPVLSNAGNNDFNNNSQLHVPIESTSEVVSNKGFIIEAEDVVYVSIRVRSDGSQWQAGALVSKGLSALGTDFRIGGMISQAGPTGGHATFAAILATEDNTQVTIDELPAGISIVNYSGTLPATINLNKHQSYIIAVATSFGGVPNDFVGGLIRATKPIVVNSGSATGTFGVGGGRDYGFDQIVGADKIGTEYIFVRGNGEDSWENVLLIADESDTAVFINGNATAAVTLDAGEYYVIEGNNYTSDNLYVQTSKSVFAYQGIGGLSGQEPNQGLFFVPPLSCENRGNVDNITQIDKIGSGTFTGGITIVTNKDALVTINDTNIGDLSGVQGPFDVEGNTVYETYKVSGLSGTTKVESTGELYCAYFNFNGAAASGSFYSGFPSAPEINFEATFDTLGNCLPNVALEAANTDLFDGFEWFFDDGSGFVTTGNTTPTHTPTMPGKYKLITRIDCTGTLFESAEIPVSICPDNADGDGVIDNVDADIDNDGILNCDESLGNATINIADSTNPIIVFQDASTNSDIVSSGFTQNSSGDVNTFTGQSNGDFTSVINPGSTSDLSYQIDFTEPVNFKLIPQTGVTHSVTDGAYFIIKIGPNHKNITLLNPDENLLVDTNFDGAFEANVLSFSSSEIHFKFKTDFTGIPTFQFVANKVDQIVFQHISNGIASQATFQGNISLTCFALDSDGDGIENAVDVDSDNDGILDIYEGVAQNIVLSGNDRDNDGIDDVFDGLLTSSDTDGDGVLNYLDVDADNDGIFDWVESGYNLTDANEDGVIDEATTATVGANGLLDTLEDTSETLLLLTPTSDTDGDGVFNFLELDADNDACFDVTEAGFNDNDSDGWLGVSPVIVNNLGKVTSGVGYTTPNVNYITNAPIIVNSFNDVTFCENDTNTISIDSNADSFQWQVSTDDGATFASLVNDARYSGVTTENLQITETPVGFNTYQYRVLLSKIGNSCLEQPSSAIVLTVNPKPVFINNPVSIEQCVNTPDGLTTLNLTTAESIISENPNGTFEYYEDVAGTNLITNITGYPVEVNIAKIVYVKVISEFGCSRELVTLTINVAETEDNTYDALQPAVCDDFLDADGNDTPGSNDDTDAITQFSLDATTIINNINPPANTIVFFYENADDRANSLHEIDITNYRNDINKIDITPIVGGIQFPIYYKLVSTLNNNCTGLGQFYLQINTVPIATVVNNMIACDNLDDGNATNGEVAFNLESNTPTILGTQSAADYTVTYHETPAQAQSGANPLASPYTNTTRDLQTIYVRVTNNTTGCFTNHEQFDLIVNPLPVANFVDNIEICDDASDGSASNGFSQSIDLSVQTATILGTQDPTQFSVTYHDSLEHAQSGFPELNTTSFQNSIPFRQTIYVRVFNATTGCANGISTFDVIVHGAPNVLLTDISNLSLCDDATDGDDTNGVVQNFDLTTQTTSILNNYDIALHDDFTISYHRSQAHAETGDSPITDSEASQYQNTPQPDGNPERIYIRVTNKDTGCISTDTYFDLIVNPLPDFEVTTPQIVCLNDTPLTLIAENPTASYSYQWTLVSDVSVLGNNQTLDVLEAGVYRVTATNTTTGCSRFYDITVNASEPAKFTLDDITIVDDSDNNTISINTTNLGIGDYEYALTNEQGDFVKNYQDTPVFENLEGGIYTILIRDKNGCDVTGVPTLTVPVIEYPKFFTPNNDGVNDTWFIKGANSTFFQSSAIYIFNRYGKAVAEIKLNEPGWDGTYNGKKLPSDDYWFSIKLQGETIGNRERKGHFSLIRKR